jgi:lysophospholipase L1-like esterase
MTRSTSTRVCLGLALTAALCALTQSASAVSPTKPKPVKLPSGASYVAIGSSYAAGFGISPQETNSGSCGRSLVDYPHLVAKKLHLHLSDVSCGGAVTANALNTPQGSAPPQLKAVTAKTRLVTITIGGNDVGYVLTAIGCGSQATCASTANKTQLSAEFKALPTSLTKLVKAVRAKAPKVTIVLVTYPRLVPARSCGALHYSPAGARFVRSIGARLQAVFVSVAKRTHIRLADPYALAAGHGPCAQGARRWIAGQVPTNGFEYHPTAAGHQEMARLVEKALN